MNSSRRKIAAILEALGVPPSARRQNAIPAAPACESLEGRQLLAGDMGLGMAALGGLDMTGLSLGAADVSTTMPTTRGGWGGGSGLGGAAIGQGVTVPGLGSASDTGAGVGASSAKVQADSAKVQADFEMIRDQSLVTPAMSSKVTTDFAAVKSAETTTPNQAFVTNLDNLAKSFNSTPGGPTLGQDFELEIYQNVVYLSEGVAPSLLNQLNADEAAVMAATGITAAQESTLATDEAAMMADQSAMRPVAASPTAIATTMGTATAVTPAAAGSMTAASTTAASTPMALSTAPAMMGGVGMSELATAGASVLLSSSGAGMSMMGDTGALGLGLEATPTSTNPAGMTLITDQATLKTDMQTLSGEMKTIDATSAVTPAMEAVVRTDLMVVKGAASASPNAADVATLKADMTTALTNTGGPTANQTAQVYADEAAVYASEGVNTILTQKLQTAEQAILSASGITGVEEGALYGDQQMVKADLTKVQADIQALAPATTITTTTGNGTTTTSPATPGVPGFGQARSFRPMQGPDSFLP